MSRPVAYVALPEGGSLPPFEWPSPFIAVLIAEFPAALEWRAAVANWLVDAGCLYAIAWGSDCEAWHDEVDWAVLERHDFGDIPDDRFVMTTWHSNEVLDQAFWFAHHCASHPDVQLDATLLVHLTSHSSAEAILRRFAEARHWEEE